MGSGLRGCLGKWLFAGGLIVRIRICRIMGIFRMMPLPAVRRRFTMYMPPSQHPDKHLMNDRTQRGIQDGRGRRRMSIVGMIHPTVGIVSRGSLCLVGLWNRLIRRRHPNHPHRNPGYILDSPTCALPRPKLGPRSYPSNCPARSTPDGPSSSPALTTTVTPTSIAVATVQAPP